LKLEAVEILCLCKDGILSTTNLTVYYFLTALCGSSLKEGLMVNNNANFMDKTNRPKFLVDFMLGRLARWMRLLGYDTVYADSNFDEKMILSSLKEGRVLVTRNSRISSKRAWLLTLIKADKFPEQIKQLTAEHKLDLDKNYFCTRCTFCNAELKTLEDRNSVKNQVPEYVFNTTYKFSICPDCGKLYGPGTHYDLLLKTLKSAGIILC
jgi:uncharacterized protein